MFFETATNSLKQAAANDLSEFGLKASIIVLAVIFIIAAIVIKNKLALAAILAYMLLP